MAITPLQFGALCELLEHEMDEIVQTVGGPTGNVGKSGNEIAGYGAMILGFPVPLESAKEAWLIAKERKGHA